MSQPISKTYHGIFRISGGIKTKLESFTVTAYTI
jgi:hypothetical protein